MIFLKEEHDMKRIITIMTLLFFGGAQLAWSQNNTLDQAYDQGGVGAGRTITADAVVVHISGPDGLSIDSFLSTTPID